jgi:hypothetical protein
MPVLRRNCTTCCLQACVVRALLPLSLGAAAVAAAACWGAVPAAVVVAGLQGRGGCLLVPGHVWLLGWKVQHQVNLARGGGGVGWLSEVPVPVPGSA